ncbi:NAD(P)-dependent alcohol dehydrogenase [Jejuia pallidilutea]|uniref:Alcohol dehydrogenase zinc-containing n=1 Tax=Jejuia pallidilutea TaxID=504487 RepID=A0A090W8B3_9FLAO|nr:NAD(P)-dependent alcohol dehydrogenase [Jejuia pallidilutea]GAL65678.1 alcohol dehydrogenase zinc-containing [Jejuia pallidilutea]GAL72423.1 alcohol dehydrogenase zinc-containing [Jejuia pallidilutea]GAL88648.1 alcohol dehydrogenase zinc-containing [Jejuia pallidilutea]
MKAVIYEKYGPPEVLKLKEIKKPKPKDNEILVKIYAATVTSGDVRLRSSNFPPLFWLPARLIFGLFKPKKTILGHELSGVIEGIGKDVSKFKVGDDVFGTTTMLKTGSYAEYICLPEKWKNGVISLKPKNLSHEKAAALPVGAMTAIFLLNKANLSKNSNTLIYGASGSVGSYAVQIASKQGAKVTAVCSSSNFEMVKSLGAKSCLDYKKQDYSKSNEKFDIVFDAVGKTKKSKAKKVLNEGGKFVSVNMLTKEKIENLELIKDNVEKNQLEPFIDKTFKLEEIVEAHKYVDKGRKRGNVIIKIQ